MTGIAGDFLMFALQFEIGFIVIEILNTFDEAERLLGMALRTVLPELVAVNIFVAIRAIVEFKSFEFLVFLPVFSSGFMARDAGYLLMFSCQLKFRFAMIEFACRFECFEIMAVIAIC